VREAGDPTRGAEIVAALARSMIFEIIPVGNVDRAIDALPPSSSVSVTCSPSRGIGATQRLTERLLAHGHQPIPHLSARLVESPAHAADLARWIADLALPEIIVIGGDAPAPAGPYDATLPFLAELVRHPAGLRRVGVAAYPDGHPHISGAALAEALDAKQTLAAGAGIELSATTQMCLDPARIRGWLASERARGLTTPVVLGIPGVVDRAKLLTMGVKLGIGPSLRYLAKNASSVVGLLAPGGFDPTGLVTALAPDAGTLGITGLHSFTFNAVEATDRWRSTLLGR
jgi:methylenetetrahydrofolate reductase (NADPH)